MKALAILFRIIFSAIVRQFIDLSKGKKIKENEA